MPIITRENIEVRDTETEIIEPQETDKEKDRILSVSNGDYEIELKAWGSNDGETWVEKDTLIIPANNTGSLTVGPNVRSVKLTGNTTTPSTTSIVDASLTY